MDKDITKAWDARFPSDKARERAVSSIRTLAGNTAYMSGEAIAEQAKKIVDELLGEVNHILERQQDDLK
jgi:hypothetical protein